MCRYALLPSLAAASLALAPWHSAEAAAEESFRCGGRIVHVGDLKLDLMGRCGRPTLVDQRVEERSGFRGDGRAAAGYRNAVTIEQWTYDFGPHQFTHVVTLEGGRIARIESGGYGYRAPPRPDAEAMTLSRARCESSALHVGDTKLDLLARCGEPATADLTVEERGAVARDGALRVGQHATVQVETWTYDFGPHQFVHFVVLENGKVIRIERGSYGYAR